ncbi:hypothetical protein SAMN06298216_4022 [Spirosomataceae bacterium TFI 002]|nr:hypothetical protein SAMN06298216_4022 [Spirosomataceae bacterium TFI 002]
MKHLLLVIILLSPILMNAQRNTNYDESKVPKFELPSVLEKAKNTNDWEKGRRAEILAQFESEVYGKTNLDGLETSFKVVQTHNDACDGMATMKEVKCTLTKGGKSHSFDIIIFLPNSKPKAPIFLGLNFYGNQSISDDKRISLSQSWVPNKEAFNILDNKINDASRGTRAYRWPIKEIIERGYGLANIYCGDLDPDFDDGFQNGVHSILGETTMGTIGAWALGLSKAMDYFEQDDAIDDRKVAILGHSRLGKAALWASAQDERFAITFSNESGCGGAALSKRAYGETVKVINTSFPHWFSSSFKAYNNNEASLPVDQHQLLSLVAPRALYVASAEGDQWSDPRGEYLSLFYTNDVYQLYSKAPLTNDSPQINVSRTSGPRGYHIRSGKHEVEPIDWNYFLDFADSQFN